MSEPAVVRRGVVGDLEAILGVQCRCVGAPTWSEAIWNGMLASENEDRVVILAERRGELVGMVAAAVQMEIGQLESIAVVEPARRQGVGRTLCLAAMAWAQRRGAIWMELEVRASSEAALRLYRSLGLEEQGRRREYYSEPAEDAVLMGMELVIGG